MSNSGPKGRRETQLALQRAVAELSLTRSPGDISIKEIAETADVTAGLVHYYYETKDDLIGATLVMLAENLLEPTETDDPRQLAETFLDRLVAEPSFVRIGCWLVLSGPRPHSAMGRFPLVDRLRETMEPELDRDARIASALSVVLAAAFFAPVVSDATGAPCDDVVANLRTITGDLTAGN